jgi:ABC-type uncharacterized transport system involved in gliding motility, auxiliary component
MRTRRPQQILAIVLVLVVAGLLAFLSQRYKTEWDWTYGGRNTLSSASRRLLKSMPDPVHLTAFVYSDQSQQRQQIQKWVSRYQRFKPNLTVRYVDPSRDPELVKKDHIQEPGEVVLEYDGRKQTLSKLNEKKISTALLQLSQKGSTEVVFLQGDGERSISEAGQNAYSDFAQALRNRGLKVAALNLALQPRIPAKASVLVIASPSHDLLAGEQKIIEQYVARGGNLLWLADTDHPPGLQDLAQQLQVQWQDGFAVFPNYAALGTGSPGIYLSAKYPPNPVTRGFHQITVFPFVRGITSTASKVEDRKSATDSWSTKPLLTTSASSWLEAGSPKSGAITFDPKKGDIAGPLTLGLTLTRAEPTPAAGQPAAASSTPAAAASAAPPAGASATSDHSRGQQRVALIGDADFLSNGNLHVLGNGELGNNLIEWLASRDQALNIHIKTAPDRALFLNRLETWLIALGFTIALPILLLGTGLLRWFRRRRR